MKVRKDFLTKYFVKLVTGAYDIYFFKYLDYVGRIHAGMKEKEGGEEREEEKEDKREMA